MFWRNVRSDFRAIFERDPAARSGLEVLLSYPSIHAMFWHRVAHALHRRHLKLIARLISQAARWFTGIEIHPGATIGPGMFIDHGMGVVIGETCEIGANCTLYQGVTLGGTGKDTGKRHPTLGDGVMVGAGSKVLGPILLGSGTKVGAGSVVLGDVPCGCTVVGNPGRVVRCYGRKVGAPREDMDQIHLPDPVATDIQLLQQRLLDLEQQVKRLQKSAKEE